MNALDGHTFCTVCNQYVPEGVACTDPDCPIIESDNEGDLTSEDYPEPIDFGKLEDQREYVPEEDGYFEDHEYGDWDGEYAWQDATEGRDWDVERG